LRRKRRGKKEEGRRKKEEKSRKISPILRISPSDLPPLSPSLSIGPYLGIT